MWFNFTGIYCIFAGLEPHLQKFNVIPSIHQQIFILWSFKLYPHSTTNTKSLLYSTFHFHTYTTIPLLFLYWFMILHLLVSNKLSHIPFHLCVWEYTTTETLIISLYCICITFPSSSLASILFLFCFPTYPDPVAKKQMLAKYLSNLCPGCYHWTTLGFIYFLHFHLLLVNIQ